MILNRTFFSLNFILLTEIIFSSGNHPDCNHDRVVKRLLYMCSTYGAGSSSVKRETNGGVLLNNVPDAQSNNNGQVPLPAFNGNTGAVGQPQQYPPYPYPYLQNYNGGFPQVQQPMYQTAPGQPVVDNSVNSWQAPSDSQSPPWEGTAVASWPTPPTEQLLPTHRERLHRPSDPSNDPEDFTSFNDYFLNPVYADADWQSSIERWRRNPHVADAIYHFIQNKCCVGGCPFPDDYWELDKQVNICEMR